MSNIKKNIQTEYANWLNTFKWTHFVTLTTPYELTVKSSRRLVERFHAKLKEHHYEPLIFWVAEKFEVKDGFHIHLLLRLNKKISKHEYIFITQLYQIVTGSRTVKELANSENNKKKWSRIDLQKYTKGRNSGMYVTKYVIKENSNKYAEYDILN
jgi:hypothetical protein